MIKKVTDKYIKEIFGSPSLYGIKKFLFMALLTAVLGEYHQKAAKKKKKKKD